MAGGGKHVNCTRENMRAVCQLDTTSEVIGFASSPVQHVGLRLTTCSGVKATRLKSKQSITIALLKRTLFFGWSLSQEHFMIRHPSLELTTLGVAFKR